MYEEFELDLFQQPLPLRSFSPWKQREEHLGADNDNKPIFKKSAAVENILETTSLNMFKSNQVFLASYFNLFR